MMGPIPRYCSQTHRQRAFEHRRDAQVTEAIRRYTMALRQIRDDSGTLKRAKEVATWALASEATLI
jgi:hypothetical protein